MPDTPQTLRLILGDQLNYKHSWYKNTNPSITYLIMEMKQETGYVLHHAQKITAFFASMFNFAAWLQKKGHLVIHLRINDPDNTQSLRNNITQYITRLNIQNFEYQGPDEYRLEEELQLFCKNLSIPSKKYSTEHFLTSRKELGDFFEGKKTFLMENFYRYMRKKHHILMEPSGKPSGGSWNFDTHNRQAYKGEIPVPPILSFRHNYSEILDEINKAGISYFGATREEDFNWPTSRKQSLQLLAYFTNHLLPSFGRYQDAMHTQQPYFFHSRLSFALNVKMLSPQEVIDKAIASWEAGKAELSSVEGFVRQILGWREYMRGIYWSQMPGYKTLNYFGHTRKLPQWYWTGKTKMNCMKQCIQQSLQEAYAHHIQRLMITGNFSLLAGLDPDEVDKWYLGIYIDAIEWVEITNTRGMSQFADGGIVGSKPYVSSAAYINKMSNYCKKCYYNKDLKTGEAACPFNSLYWHFFHRHRDLLAKNPRIGFVYPTLDNMDKQQLHELLETAENNLLNLETL